jgi:galacturan 1,4-alpha-galacturonidase
MRVSMLSLAVTVVGFASLATARLSCVVKALGGGLDDGPNILAAFRRCASNGRVTLAGYYVVDTLLLTTGLDDVEVELSGTST